MRRRAEPLGRLNYIYCNGATVVETETNSETNPETNIPNVTVTVLETTAETSNDTLAETDKETNGCSSVVFSSLGAALAVLVGAAYVLRRQDH